MKNNATELICKLQELGITNAFLVTGGAAMFLNDALIKSEIRITAFHHEQAASMAAEAYARISGKPALLMITAGPGAINAMNGVFGAFTDSIPMIVISGQARTDTLRKDHESRKLRQMGDQEADIPRIVEPIVKKVKQVNPNDNISELAVNFYYESVSGRPGPVWIDFPINLQSYKFEKESSPLRNYEINSVSNQKSFGELLNRILLSQRPTFLLGSGVSCDISRQHIKRIDEQTSIVLQPAWTGIDLVKQNFKNFGGRPSTVGDRSGGLVQSCSDLIIVLGSSLSIRQIGFNSKEQFTGQVVHIDIDAAYSKINRDFEYDFIPEDPNQFLEYLVNNLHKIDPELHSGWLNRVSEVVKKLRVEKSWSEENSSKINPYKLFEILPSKFKSDAIFACADASASVIFFQSANLKSEQKCFTNAGSASMGYELPAAIGAAIASKSEIICIAGDGSFQQNLQELPLINYHKLKINIIYINNDGYLSIKTSQHRHFNNVKFTSQNNGLPFPNMKQLIEAYGLEYVSCSSIEEFEKINFESIYGKFVDCNIDPEIKFNPKSGSRLNEKGEMISSPIYDLEPNFDENEINKIRDYLNLA